jgi:hypothetical protein
MKVKKVLKLMDNAVASSSKDKVKVPFGLFTMSDEACSAAKSRDPMEKRVQNLYDQFKKEHETNKKKNIGVFDAEGNPIFELVKPASRNDTTKKFYIHHSAKTVKYDI